MFLRRCTWASLATRVHSPLTVIPAFFASVCSIHQPSELQGYLDHKKLPPPKTLQYARAWGPAVFLGGGGSFL